MTARRPGRWVPWVVLGAAVAWLLVREWHYSGWMDDDAFISFRYARNLARGAGLVFNAGERVEGYTNFLWTVLLGAAAKAGFDIPRAAQVLGVLFSLAGTAVVVHLGRRLAAAVRGPTGAGPGGALDGLGAVLPAVLLCVSESWAVWAVGGLENVFAAFWVLLAMAGYVRYRSSSSGAPGPAAPAAPALYASAAACVLAALTHPAHALVACVLGTALLRDAVRGTREWRPFVTFGAIFTGAYGAYFVLRAAYYGDLLPNTFYAKVGTSAAMVERGGAYLGTVAAAFPFLLAACVAAGMQAAVHRRAVRDADAALARHVLGVMLAAVAAYLAYALAIGGEAFPALRLFVVPLPLAATAAVAGLGGLRTPWRAAAMAVLLTGTAVCSYASPKMRQLDRRIENDSLALYRTAGLVLKQNLPPNTLFAYSGAGVLAYYSELPFLDTLGLTDRHIAHTVPKDLGAGMAGHEKGDGAYVLSRHPDYVMFTGTPISSSAPRFRSDHELNALQEFHFQYQLVKVPFRYTTRRHPHTFQADLYLYKRIAGP